MDEVQQSEAWFAARRGKVTASRIADLMATTRTGPAASRKNLLADLTVELLTDVTTQTFQSAAMAWGNEQEEFARRRFEIETGEMVVETGLIVHPNIDQSGASPDGLVGEDRVLEIKCPNTSTHIDTLKTAKIADRYVKQMQWQLACTERDYAMFVSFDPRLPHGLDYFEKRIGRDDKLITEMEAAVEIFIAELNEQVEFLRGKIDG